MELVVAYPNISRGFAAALRFDAVFDRDTLTGLNVLIDYQNRVVLGLVFDDPEHRPDLELLTTALIGGIIIATDLKGVLESGREWKIRFLGDGLPAFKAYIEAGLHWRGRG